LSYKYYNLKEAYDAVKKAGEKIELQKIPEALCPLVFAITGAGRCS